MRRALFLVWLTLAAAGLPRGGWGQPAGAAAPYVGEYTLDQGGTDAAGAVHLLLFAGGDYAIVYFGGMQQGTWRAKAGGELELREWAGDPAEFAVYGRANPSLGGQVRVQFQGFQESYAKIGLRETLRSPVALHSAFNAEANCYADSYAIRRPAARLAALELAAYQEAARRDPDEPVQFGKALLYTYLLDKRYNDYQVVYNAAASKPAARYLGRYVHNALTLYAQGAGGRPPGAAGDSYGERSAISATDRREMAPVLREARRPLPARLTIRQPAGGPALTYQRLLVAARPRPAAIPLLGPLFVASCK